MLMQYARFSITYKPFNVLIVITSTSIKLKLFRVNNYFSKVSIMFNYYALWFEINLNAKLVRSQVTRPYSR